MKSSQYVGFVFATIVSCSVAFGQDAQPAEKPQTPAEGKKAAPPSDKGVRNNPHPIKPILDQRAAQRQDRPGYGHDPMVDRRLAAFVRLRELMFESVKLDPEQRKKIKGMFDDYMAGLLNPEQKPHLQPRREDMATPQELPELHKQLEAAEKDDDEEKIASIKAKIYCANIVLEPCVIDEPVFFFEYVRKELNEKQRMEFDPVLNRWRFLRLPEISPDNDFKQLRRATRDPVLRETDEFGKQLDAMIIESVRTVPLGPKRIDPDVMKELAASTKPKLLEKMNPKQREHFEKTIELLKKWDKEDPELAKKTRERLKDYQPGHASAEHSTAPAKSSSTTP